MRILITGGAGFIGSHLADRLVARGDQVMSLDNFSTSRRINIIEHPSLKVVEGSVEDRQFMNRIFEDFKPEIVVHAAASYKDPDDHYNDALTNVVGTVNVVQISKRHNVERIIYLQTSLCYGLKPLEQPVKLEHLVLPALNSYAVSKTAAEQYVEMGGVPFVSFRLANVYGPRNISGPLPIFWQRVSGGKACFAMDTRRDFVYVDDMTDLLERTLNKKDAQGFFHVSSGKDISIEDLYKTVVKVMGAKPTHELEVRPRSDEDAFTILLDPKKTLESFGWEATTSLEEGIRQTIQWYEKYGVGETYTHLKEDPAKKT